MFNVQKNYYPKVKMALFVIQNPLVLCFIWLYDKILEELIFVKTFDLIKIRGA